MRNDAHYTTREHFVPRVYFKGFSEIKKKKTKQKKKKRGGGQNFLLKLDRVQLARRGGFLNACET